MNYKEAATTLGKRDRRKVARNTYLERRENGIALRLHATDVVTMHPNGAVTLNTGGWAALATRDRMSMVVRVHFAKGILNVTHGGKVYPVNDGMILGPRGGVRHAVKDTTAQAWRDKVSAYADAFVAKLFNRELPAPSAADCWYCAMQTADGKPLGGNDHIREHVKEGYYVPSMLNAVSERLAPIVRSDVGYYLGVHDHVPGAWSASLTKRQVRGALRRYIGSHTGVALR